METINMLNGIHPMSPELINHLSNILTTVTLKRNEYLLNAGEVCKNVYFVNEGLLRCFSLKKDGVEACTWFMKENDVVFAGKSFLTQMPSTESIQALEDCTLQYITYSQLRDIYTRFPEFNFHSRKWIEKYCRLSKNLNKILETSNPLERYKLLLQNQAEYIGRVENKHIASYLGVSLSTLNKLERMAKQTLTGHIKF